MIKSVIGPAGGPAATARAEEAQQTSARCDATELRAESEVQTVQWPLKSWPAARGDRYSSACVWSRKTINVIWYAVARARILFLMISNDVRSILVSVCSGQGQVPSPAFRQVQSAPNRPYSWGIIELRLSLQS